jgi:homoserine dehydrogenase
MRQINIGLLGCGTVGTGVAKMILEKKELLTARVGAEMNLQWVADIDTETDRGIRFDDGVFIKDARKVVQDSDVDIIIEMIGGEGIAKDLILEAVGRGKHIVTANKALLASQGNELIPC